MTQSTLQSTDYDEHPVFNPLTLHLETHAMKQLSEDIHRWLWTGATGGLIVGKSRAGKTTALQHLSKNLYTRGNIKIPCYFVSIPERDVPSVASIFRLLCLSKDLRVSGSAQADILSNHYIHYIADEAIKSKCNKAVLFVDDMQRLTAKQLNAFAELYDGLLRLQILLTVIFIGNNPECWRLVKIINSDVYAHIRGRFFTQSTSFHGLRSKAEIKACLLQYDKLRYPENGPTYTEFFLPNAVKEGWELALLSNDIWRVYNEYKRNYKIESWGMKYFTATINTLLADFLPNNDVSDINDEIIHECIRVSNLIPSLVVSEK